MKSEGSRCFAFPKTYTVAVVEWTGYCVPRNPDAASSGMCIATVGDHRVLPVRSGRQLGGALFGLTQGYAGWPIGG
jgi:hypothetical protein